MRDGRGPEWFLIGFMIGMLVTSFFWAVAMLSSGGQPLVGSSR